MNSKYIFLAILALVGLISCKGQQDTAEVPLEKAKPEMKEKSTEYGPATITRNIIQDKNGNIWLAAFDGVFKYDGKSFYNVTKEVSSARFFSIMEDGKGNLWFGSIGSGVYRYDGSSFQNFTTDNGLINNEVVCIYEDKVGNIWFGANGGASLYNGETFRNFKLERDTIFEDRTGSPVPSMQRPMDEVNAIVEDDSGNLWFATRGRTFIYDGKSFNKISQDEDHFYNIRMITKDDQGNMWLGGNGGLWFYDGEKFSKISKEFFGYVYKDRKGNIWTSSESSDGWVLSCYDEKSLFSKTPKVTKTKSAHEGNKGMIFGILESNDGSIWFGGLDGAYLYDGNSIHKLVS